jgi:hypothetical protein
MSELADAIQSLERTAEWLLAGGPKMLTEDREAIRDLKKGVQIDDYQEEKLDAHVKQMRTSVAETKALEAAFKRVLPAIQQYEKEIEKLEALLEQNRKRKGTVGFNRQSPICRSQWEAYSDFRRHVEAMHRTFEALMRRLPSVPKSGDHEQALAKFYKLVGGDGRLDKAMAHFKPLLERLDQAFENPG